MTVLSWPPSSLQIPPYSFHTLVIHPAICVTAYITLVQVSLKAQLLVVSNTQWLCAASSNMTILIGIHYDAAAAGKPAETSDRSFSHAHDDYAENFEAAGGASAGIVEGGILYR